MNFLNSKWRDLCTIIGWCSIICLAPPNWVSANDDNVEYKVKAGYLYNFTKFVTWPDDKYPVFNICILGTNPFGGLLDPIEQKTAFGHPIQLYKLKELKPDQHCHIIYIGTLTEKNIAVDNALIGANTNGSLTVGEDKAFINQGGMIGFVNREGKIKLQINQQKLKQSGLEISSKLLEVAELIGNEDD